MGMKFGKNPLAVERNSYLNKNVNVCIVYDLDAWPKIPRRNIAIKNCLFGATGVVKNSNNKKYVYMAMKQHLIGNVSGVLIIVLLETL